MQYIDLSHKIDAHIPVYPGDPKPEIIQNNSVITDTFSSHTITIGTHVGTHIDAPAHMIQNGKTLTEYPVDYFIGKAIIIDVREKNEITEQCLEEKNLDKYSIVFFYTGRDRIYHTQEYFTEYPQISAGCAQKLINAQIKIIGMDQASPDYAPFLTHKLLLENDVLIIENLTNLQSLIQKDTITIYAFPVKTDLEAAQVRVIAEV